MTRRMYLINFTWRALVAAAIGICAADRALSRMNRRQRALAARVKALR